MTTDHTLRIATIGGWGHWPQVLDELMAMPEAQVIATAPAYKDEPLHDLLNHPKITEKTERFSNCQTMLEKTNPEVVIVSTRLDQIAPAATECARRGCHIICEKPLAIDEENLDKFQKAVLEHNIRVLAMLTMRTLPAFLAARKFFRQGHLGEFVLANARKSYRWGTRPEWFGHRDIYGGTIPWIGIHTFDMIHFITGKRFSSITAAAENAAHPQRPECEDHAALLARLAGGGLASMSLDYFRPDDSSTHGDDWLRIVGTKGILEAYASRAYCHAIIEGQGEVEIPLEPQSDPMFLNFLRSIGKPEAFSPSTEDCFHLTRAVLTARQAADSQAWLEIT